ncbi:hypothetical protein [Lusitaniella coriacea]|uniref:hypothetical protein n=1 Tax=Lusitaniella coriacea TaxID=1983105 RepID=UPI003CF37907
MNSQDRQKSREVEVEVESPFNPFSPNGKPQQPSWLNGKNREKAQQYLQQAREWFDSLPVVGKVIVGLFAISVSFSLLKTVFQIVSALISMAILGVLIYGVYKFFIAPQSPES